jgi:DnaJ-class molecular chaperone
MKIQNYYKLLELSNDSSCEELYNQCKNLFIKNHPTRNNTHEAYKKFILVNDAYALFLDNLIRNKYDYLLAKYAVERSVEDFDKNIIKEIFDLIIEKRKGIKDMLDRHDDTFLVFIRESPISFESDERVNDLIEGITNFNFDSIPDFDID